MGPYPGPKPKGLLHIIWPGWPQIREWPQSWTKLQFLSLVNVPSKRVLLGQSISAPGRAVNGWLAERRIPRYILPHTSIYIHQEVMAPYLQLLINCGVILIDTSGRFSNGNLLWTKDNWSTLLDFLNFVREVWVYIHKIYALWCLIYRARPLCVTQ